MSRDPCACPAPRRALSALGAHLAYSGQGVTDDLSEPRRILRQVLGDRSDALAALEGVEAAVAAAQEQAARLADLGHELRGPLGVILGYCQLLRQDRRLPAESRAHAEVIQRSGEQLLALVDELTGAEESGASACDLHRLLDELADMLCLRAAGAGVALRFERGAGLPRLVQLDPRRLRSLLLLLIDNVIAAAGDDVVVVRVEVEAEAAADVGVLRCRISAPRLRGEGLELRDFVRADAGRIPTGPDPLAAHVEPLGGRVRVSDGELALELPVDLTSAPRLASTEPLPVLAPDQGERRILVAGDRWQARHLLVHALRRAGFAVKEAVSGREALRVWETWRPHLVWMDMHMPLVSGIEATRQIKASPQGAETVVLGLTTRTFEGDEVTALAAGCDGVVCKPAALGAVFAALADHLGVRYQDAASPGGVAEGELAGLPQPWLAALGQASVQADIGAIHRMIDFVRAQAPGAASALTRLADHYDYAGILGLVRRATQGGA